MSSCHLLLGRPLDLFPLLGCHYPTILPTLYSRPSLPLPPTLYTPSPPLQTYIHCILIPFPFQLPTLYSLPFPSNSSAAYSSPCSHPSLPISPTPCSHPFPSCAGTFFLGGEGGSHTSDLKIDTLVATLPGTWRYRVSTGTGLPGVSILRLGEVESWICNFYLSVAARTIVGADPSPRYTSLSLGR